MSDMASDDMTLAGEYARSGSEQAFATLVSHHINMVYSVALRRTRDHHLAEDIAQGVFALLARKAASLPPGTILSAWLCRAARYVAADMLKTQKRRQSREHESAMQSESNEMGGEAWALVAPLLDEAIEGLCEAEQSAVTLRFFENQSFKEVGAALGLEEDAARMRVNRAVEKLREFFKGRGVELSSTAIAAAIGAHSIQAAPAGLAASVVAGALSAGLGSSAGLAAAATKTIAMTTIQKTMVWTSLAILAGAVIYQARLAAEWRDEFQTLQRQREEQTRQAGQQGDAAARRFGSLADELQAVKSGLSELPRLRGEVARLREEARAASAKIREAEAIQTALARFMSNTPLVRTFVSPLTVAEASWGEAVVMGGWKLPSGKRALMLAMPRQEQTPQAVGVKASILEYTEEAGAALGLEEFNSDAPPPRRRKLSASEVEALVSAAKESSGISVRDGFSLTTLSGRRARLQSGETHMTPAGENYWTGAALDLVPTISPDGQSVQMTLSSQLNCPLGIEIPSPAK